MWQVLKPRPSGTTWVRGGVAAARWQQTAAHGGGYQYRLCPASEPLTEECFQRHPLEFASPYTHTARFADPALDRKIKATPVVDGPAKGWMRLPLPFISDVACDYVVTEGHCQWDAPDFTHCPGCKPPHYAADTACPSTCKPQWPELPANAGSDPNVFPDPLPGARALLARRACFIRLPRDLHPASTPPSSLQVTNSTTTRSRTCSKCPPTYRRASTSSAGGGTASSPRRSADGLMHSHHGHHVPCLTIRRAALRRSGARVPTSRLSTDRARAERELGCQDTRPRARGYLAQRCVQGRRVRLAKNHRAQRCISEVRAISQQ